MSPDGLIARVEQAQREGHEKVGGRGIERRLELPEVVFYPEVGQPVTAGGAAMIASLIAFFVLLGATIVLWSDYEKYMLLPIAAMVGCVATFFRGANAGTRKQLERQESVERNGLYLAGDALFYLQDDRSLYVPRERVTAVRLQARAEQAPRWGIDYLDESGDEKFFPVCSGDHASRPVVEALRAWHESGRARATPSS